MLLLLSSQPASQPVSLLLLTVTVYELTPTSLAGTISTTLPTLPGTEPLTTSARRSVSTYGVGKEAALLETQGHALLTTTASGRPCYGRCRRTCLPP